MHLVIKMSKKIYIICERVFDKSLEVCYISYVQ